MSSFLLTLTSTSVTTVVRGGFGKELVMALNCELCGQPLPEPKGKGRPRVFHDECRKMANLLGWMEDLVGAIDFVPEKASQVRRQLWGMGNQVKAKGQKGVKNG